MFPVLTKAFPAARQGQVGLEAMKQEYESKHVICSLPISIRIAAQSIVQKGPVQVQSSSAVELSTQMRDRFLDTEPSGKEI